MRVRVLPPVLENIALPERVVAGIDASGGPEACWPWTRGKFTDSQGQQTYGAASIGGKVRHVHRAVWIALNGEPPSDAPFVLHTCDNPPCCNPAHLYAGSHKDNMRDMTTRGRASRGGAPTESEHWKRAHRAGVRRGSEHPFARLTDEQVAAIRAEPQAWGVVARLAREYGVSHTTISKVRRRMRRAA